MNAQVDRYREALRVVAFSMLLASLTAIPVSAQSIELGGHTIAGGGGTNSTDNQPGGFALSGTIGQPAARPSLPPLMGGGFELVGGLWPAIAATCPRAGDVNLDGVVDGDDTQYFLNCVLTGTGSCSCADLDGGGIGAGDIEAFVTALLNG